MPETTTEEGGKPELRRTLTLWHAVLYGMGVTIGAGIYVLIGPAIGRAGMAAPLAFLLAAGVMALTAASFAELGSRMPVAAGEAAYVRAGFQSSRLGAWAGLLVIAIALISAAAISVGSAGYIRVFVDVPESVVVMLVVLAMGAVAAWGIKESVSLAAVMTLIEVGGLLMIVALGFAFGTDTVSRLPEAIPGGFSQEVVGGIAATALIAVFAFVGFEGIANIAEEVHEPRRTLPRAIFLTLAATTVLYVLVVWVALTAAPAEVLATSEAPLAEVFTRLTGASPRIMSAIAVVATLNGVIVQIIMASRVIYGLGRQGNLPSWIAAVNPATGTPLTATFVSSGIVLALALLLPLGELADLTSQVTLVLFALVNLALVAIKLRERGRGEAGSPGSPPESSGAPGSGTDEGARFLVPVWVPALGAASCLVILLAEPILRV